MDKIRRVHAIILGGGSGNRAKLNVPKQFIKIGGKTVFEHTIEVFERHQLIDNIIVICPSTYRYLVEEMVLKNRYKKVSKILNGGETRRESSFIGVSSIEEDEDIVLIHDAVRPFLSDRIINDCIKALEFYDAVDVAIPADDTIIRINDDNFIEDIPPRRYFMRGQTPQGFKVGVIKKAHQMALKDPDVEVTDDCGLILRYNLTKILVIEGDRFNMKITFPEDIYLADKVFQFRSQHIENNDDCS